MATPVVIRGSAYEDGGASIMARITGTDGANITQADVSTITCTVYDSSGTSVATPTVTVATSVFDTLQTDSRWSVDTTGYNFRFDVAATVMSSGNETYRYEFKFTPASGEVYWVVAEIYCYPVSTS